MRPPDTTSPEGARPRVRAVWLLIERAAWIFGICALAVWGWVHVAGIVGAQQDLKRFSTLRTSAARTASLPQARTPDLTLWDAKRVNAWRTALTQPAPQPLAILRIPHIRLEVAVLPGTNDFVLDRAVGHIEDTALPGKDSNCGIAGHRDGFFRALKDVTAGDAIELETLEGRETYHVERTWIVQPEDVSVLDPTPVRALTLVTCYPFYFIGSAPQRFIVRAVRDSAGSAQPKG